MRKFLSIFAIVTLIICAISCETEEGDDITPPAGDYLLDYWVYGEGDEHACIKYTYNEDSAPTAMTYYSLSSDYNDDGVVKDEYLTDSETTEFEYVDGYVFIKHNGSYYAGLELNSDGYVTKIFETTSATTTTITTTYTCEYDSNGYMTKYTDYSDDDVAYYELTWSNGNVSLDSRITNYEDYSSYIKSEYTYNSKTLPNCNFNVSFMFTTGDGPFITMPSVWFGQMPKNVMTGVNHYEKYSADDDWALNDDNIFTHEYTYDSNGNIASFKGYSKYIGSSTSVYGGYFFYLD